MKFSAKLWQKSTNFWDNPRIIRHWVVFPYIKLNIITLSDIVLSLFDRSPGKGSPKFKIPSCKPRGRKKGSSKKTLFKDQVRVLQQVSLLNNKWN